MRQRQSSLTAAGIALARAVESDRPEAERICFDPYARRLIPGWFYHIVGFFIRSGYAELRGPGVNGFLVARDRYIDDTLQAFLERGLQQLVVLGAGFDARPYRFEKLRHGIKVFEVDHPATQQVKTTRLAAIFGEIPAWVTFVPIDFNEQSLAERLQESGYDASLTTLFIWQGVSMYLSTEAVDQTLAFVQRGSAPGSAIVFDYIYQSVLLGVQKHSEVSNMRRYRFMSGESLSFGIPEGTIGSFLRERDFQHFKDIDAEGLKKAYFTGVNAKRRLTSGYGIVIGIV